MKKAILGFLSLTIASPTLTQHIEASNTLNEGLQNSGRYLTYDIKDSGGSTVNKLTRAETSKTVYLKGNYEVGGMTGQEVAVRYQVLAKNSYEAINEGFIKNNFVVDATNKSSAFNTPLILKTSGSCVAANEVCLPNSTSSYTIRVFIDYDSNGENQILTQMFKTITVERTIVEGHKSVAEDTELAIQMGHFKMDVRDENKGITLQGNEYFSRSNLKAAQQNFQIEGHVRVNGNLGKTVKIRYDIIDYDSYLNKSKKEGLIQSFTQTAYTDGNFIKFNRSFGIKVSSGESESNVDYNIIPDDNRDYAIRVVVQVNGVDRYLEDLPIHVSTATSGSPTGNVSNTLHENVPTIPTGEKAAYTLKKNGTNFTSVALTDLRSNRVQLDLLGAFQDIGIPEGTDITVRYKIASIDNPYYKNEEGLVSRYNQTSYTHSNKITFNRKLFIKSEANPEADNAANPTIHLKDYPAKYTFMVEIVYGTNEAVTVQKTIDFNVTGSQEGYFNVDGNTPPFPTKTNLEFMLSKYNGTSLVEVANTETNQKNPEEFLASNIKTTPLKLNIRGSFTNIVDNKFDDIQIQFDIMALENYSDASGVNKVVKRMVETVDTEGRTVEFNRDLWISTESRVNRTGDNAEGTIYVEDYTQYYTVRVTAKNLTKGTTVVLRDMKLLVKANEEAYQQKEGPGFTLPNGLSSYFFDKSGNRVETLEITARDLNNAPNGLDIDIQGFYKSNWAPNQNVDIKYELKALNSYKDYIKYPGGMEETLEKDFDDQINDSKPVDYVDRVMVEPMEKWLNGKATQTGFFKYYTITSDTQNRHEPFTRKFNLRTKLDKDVDGVKNDESVLFLDNVARSYELFVYATNKSTGEVVKKVINLKITTVKPDKNITNATPVFDAAVGVYRPEKGTGWFIDETMPMRWKPAKDGDNELMYYKSYYYYTTTDSTGLVNKEIRNWIQRVEDMPVSRDDIAYDWIVDNPAKIEPTNVRVFACDINHVCGVSTRSNPFKLNEFGVNGGAGSGGGGGGPTASIEIYPRPDGQWKSEDIELNVMYDGDADLAKGAVKKYSVTNSAIFPTSLSKTLPDNGLVTLSSNGTHFVHVQFELSNGQIISASAGPYKIDKNGVNGFQVRLENNAGAIVTDWTNQALNLVITNPTTTNISGTKKEYMIEGFHNTWQPYRDGIKVAIDGQYRVFGRVVNNAGSFGEQQYATAKIDKIKPTFDELKLNKLENGKYDVTALTYDADSGINRVVLSTGTPLSMNGSPISWAATNLVTEPISILAYDKAGNVSNNTVFLDIPTITYKNGYSKSTEVWRKDVNATIGGSGILSYKLGMKSYGCLNSPCNITIDKNSSLTAINKSGIQITSHTTAIQNIDKSPIRLVLNGQRDTVKPGKISFTWNYDITNASLICDYPGGQEQFAVSGTGVIFNGQNLTYTCQLNGSVYGEKVSSNSITVYPDYQKELADQELGGGNVTDVTLPSEASLYVEESRLGTTYIIGAKRGNSKDGIAPIPDGLFK